MSRLFRPGRFLPPPGHRAGHGHPLFLLLAAGGVPDLPGPHAPPHATGADPRRPDRDGDGSEPPLRRRRRRGPDPGTGFSTEFRHQNVTVAVGVGSFGMQHATAPSIHPTAEVVTWLVRAYGPTGQLDGWGVAAGAGVAEHVRRPKQFWGIRRNLDRFS